MVYGPADHSFSEDFLHDLDAKLRITNLPMMIAWDFNLIRSVGDKNNNLLDFSLMGFFNDSIAHHPLRELRGVSGRFSWSNNQINPTMSLLDRFLVSATWESIFHLCSVKLETRLGSDHSPLLISSGEFEIKRPRRFYMERQWFS